MYYDQVAQIDMPAWSRDRVVLIGDAAHAVSLLAGQGASLGITGAYVLAEHLSHAATVESALEGHERTLRPLITEKQQVARNGTRWFIPATPTQLRIRRTALKLARVPVIDRYVAAALAGKSTAIIDRPLGPTPPVAE
ncbi:FAD-dependent monooxygenase [Actinoallomurus acaciae]|uniref:FAD-dependent monooxygenase n=1 Tax=Actinoallomurus acaciae TaxID=502577 RepID=A0ABV5YQB5_9ACTN